MLTEVGNKPSAGQGDLERRRRRAVRTAWVLALVAGLIFAAFVLSGILAH